MEQPRPMSDVIERKNAYDYDDLIRSGKGELFGPATRSCPPRPC